MTMLNDFLQDAAATAQVSTHEVLARVLHVEDGAFQTAVAAMDDATKALALRLDREIRVRNPGLHYVVRKKFVGYRREGTFSTSLGERSQIFVSVILNSSRLEVVLPVDPNHVAHASNAEDLRGKVTTGSVTCECHCATTGTSRTSSMTSLIGSILKSIDRSARRGSKSTVAMGYPAPASSTSDPKALPSPSTVRVKNVTRAPTPRE